VTPPLRDHADHHEPASARTVRPRGRRSLAVGAAVLTAAALIGGAGGAGAAGLLTGRNVRDDSLRSADFRNGSIGAARVHDGGLSPSDVGFDLTGDKGAPGDTGLPGLPGIRAITVRAGTPVSNSSVGALNADASCNSGEIALSGGARLDVADPGTRPFIEYSVLVAPATWHTFIATPAGFKQYTPWVVCAQIP
jgi:hypothetical protein